jgi:hypothetical protein
MQNIVVTPYAEAAEKFETVPVPVLAADSVLPSVLEVPLVSGRWLNEFDEGARSRAAVIGVGLAREFNVLPGEVRSVLLNGLEYSVVGILDRVELEPAFDNAVFVTFNRAADDFLTDAALDGDALATQIKDDLRRRVAALAEGGVVPGLGTILVGDDGPSANYVGPDERPVPPMSERV